MPDATPTNAAERAPGFVRRSDLVARAYEVASDAHAGQRRKDDGSPYISHPVTVASVLHDAGFDDQVLAAALLHDTVEDTEMDSGELAGRFGDRVAELVEALSEDDGIDDYEERKREHREQVEEAGREAVAIYAADKLSNLRDMRAIYAEEGEAIGSRFSAAIDVRMALWREDLEMASRAVPSLPYLDELRAELEGFDRQRAERTASAAG